ncbi:phosphotransferase enzyme family protein [Leptodontidium sp. MPI-SDFR-AT-0119]|nr:phosphotransferase enzyme family protein [Leptodontidium sp. MPI-SDFR-AT-0119]
MPTGSQGPQQLKDRIVQSRVHHERDQFIAAIHEDDICRLASSHHNGDPCKIFKPASRGSYNICYFVQFSSHGLDVVADTGSGDGKHLQDENVEKWVVRVPLAPCLAFGRRNKLESEIATMQLVADKTTIPLPKIYAYSLDDGPEPLSSFLILEYVEGQKLSSVKLKTLSDEQRTHLYTSLADIHIQLRRLEFPSIGCLTCGPDGFEVRKKTATIDINMQELEGLEPSKIQTSYYDDSGLLTSANDYVAMLLQIANNAFVEGRSSVWERGQGEDALYHLHMFCQYAEVWVDRSLDQGPYVLVHGDFEPFNLIVNENMDIISVLDWEWSRVVPRQFFKPPLWLGIPDTTKLAWDFVYNDYLKSFNQLQATAMTRELEKYGNTLLSDEWAKAKENSGFLVANALENWTDMDWFANRYINWKCYRGKIDLDERVRMFMEENPARKSLIAKKLREGIAYEADVERLQDTGLPGEHKVSTQHQIPKTHLLQPMPS